MSIHVLSKVLRESEATLAARLVLIAIADKANDDGEAFPSPAAIASDARCTRESVRRAIKTLVSLGELEVMREATPQRAGLYRVLIGQPEWQQTIATNLGDATPKTFGPTPTQSGRTPTQSGGPKVNRQLTVKEPTAPAEPAARPRDEVWDALATVFGDPVTRGERALRGKIVRSLKEAGATGREVHRRCDAWDEHWRPDGKGSSPTLTLTALEKHWTALGKTAGEAPRILTDAEIAGLIAEDEQRRAEQQQMLDDHYGRTA